MPGRLAVGLFGDPHEAIQRFVIHRASKRFLREASQHFAGIGTTVLRRSRRFIFEKEPVVVLRPGPIPLLQRSLDFDRTDAHVHGRLLFLGRSQRLEFKREFVLVRIPLQVELEVKLFVVVPDELLIEEFLVVRLEDQPALARIEIKRAAHIQFNEEPVVPGIFDFDRVRHLRLVVKRQDFAVDWSFRGAKFAAGNGFLRHHFRRGRHSRRDDAFRGLHVFLQQQRRHSKHVADIVEAVAGVIGWKLLVRPKVSSHQIPDRISILDTIKPPDRDAARIGIFGVDPENVLLDPGLQPPAFIGRGAWFPFRGHDAGTQILQDLPPQIAFAQQLLIRLELVKGYLPFVHAIAMAIVTILDKDRLHLLPKVRPGRVLRAKAQGTKRG